MRKYLICIAASCLVLAGCGGHQAVPAPGTAGMQSKHHVGGPDVVQTGHVPVSWTQFAWGDTNVPTQYNAIVTGTDKNMWYTDYNGQALIRMKMSGAITKFPLTYGTGTHYYAGNIAVGADGKFYMSNLNNPGFIGVATTTGAFSVKAISSGDYGYDGGLVKGPDGNVWFTELQHIAKITPAGVITEYPYIDGYTTNYYGAVAVGPDGDIWATEYGLAVIDEVDPADGSMTQYPMPCGLIGLIVATDGNLWSTCSNNLVRITTGGSYTEILNPFTTDGYPSALALGQDGNPWFTINSRNMIAEYNIAANTMNVYYPPSTQGNGYGLTAGPDGNMWALDSLGKTDIYILNPLGVLPATLTQHVGNVTNLIVTEHGTTAWTATSTNGGVASVAQGSPANKFVVTAHGTGNTTITIKDAIGNSFAVKDHVIP